MSRWVLSPRFHRLLTSVPQHRELNPPPLPIAQVDAYLEVLGDSSIPEEYLRLAKYYESRAEHVKAAGLYERCSRLSTPPGQLDSQALKLYIRAGVSAMEPAIRLVGEASNPKLTSMLLDFIIGSTDGIPVRPPLSPSPLALGGLELRPAAHPALPFSSQRHSQPSPPSAPPLSPVRESRRTTTSCSSCRWRPRTTPRRPRLRG